MKVLLTASFKNGLFSNGLQQNIIFLAELIKEIGLEPMICIDHDMDKCIDPPADILIIEKNEILNYIKEVNFILNTAWMIEDKIIKLSKALNKDVKNIHILYGNSLLADVERCSWDDAIAVDNANVDEVWISPHYKFSYNYYKTYYKTDRVFELPYIWSSKYVKMHEKIWNKAGKTCFYSKDKPKNIAITEPNLNMTKHCLPAISLVEEYYNNYNKEGFDKLNVYCSSKLLDKKYFKSRMWKTSLANNGKVIFAPRKKTSHILAEECNIIVSHQLLNALNYSYLEALYFNIPLIHNSEFMKNAGYYYPDYDTKKGARVLDIALKNHDTNLMQYKKESKQILDKYSPENPEVIERYKNLFS